MYRVTNLATNFEGIKGFKWEEIFHPKGFFQPDLDNFFFPIHNMLFMLKLKTISFPHYNHFPSLSSLKLKSTHPSTHLPQTQCL